MAYLSFKTKKDNSQTYFFPNFFSVNYHLNMCNSKRSFKHQNQVKGMPLHAVFRCATIIKKESLDLSFYERKNGLLLAFMVKLQVTFKIAYQMLLMNITLNVTGLYALVIPISRLFPVIWWTFYQIMN